MDLEDIVKGKHHKYGHHDHDDHGEYHNHDQHHHDHGHHYHGGHHHGPYKLELVRSLLRSLPHKRALLTAAVILCFVALVIGIALLWVLFPLLTKLVSYVEVNGIQGILNTLLSFAQLFWKGNG
jgi:hypothetical protein